MTETKPQESYYGDDVIDLRELVKTLLKYKWIILAATLLAALAAFLMDNFLLDSQYEASAHIGIRRPTFYANLEPSIENPSALEDYRNLSDLTKSLPELAEADDIWMSVCEELDLICVGEGRNKPDLEASLIGTNQLKLTVSCEDPARCAEFANLWAEEVTYRWNTLYGNESLNLEQIAEDVDSARQLWAESQAILEAYLPESKINVVEVQLDQAKSKLTRYLNEIEANELLIRTARGLDKRLADLAQSGELLLGEALSLIGLQQRTTGGISGTQLQLPGEDLLGVDYTVATARVSLGDLIRALEAQNATLEEDLPELEIQVISLTLDLEVEGYKIQQLEQERDKVRQAYQVLAGHRDETEINQRNQGEAAYCVAKARVPQEESGPSTEMVVALAGIAGGILSVVIVYVYSWWTSFED